MSFLDVINSIFESLPMTKPKMPCLVASKVKNVTIPPENSYVLDIVSPNNESGPWLAGGAVLKWKQGKTISEDVDVDVFCASQSQLDALVEKLEKYDCQLLADTENAKTFRIQCLESEKENHVMKIQLIKKRFFSSLPELLDSFDITVSEISTDGHTFSYGTLFERDFANKVLRFKHINSASYKRYLKYSAYGFNLSDDHDFSLIVANTDWDKLSKEFDEYDIAF